MKTHFTLVAGMFFLFCGTALLPAQSTAFTYQGRLLNAGAPAEGLFEMQFTLYDALVEGNVIGTPQALAPVAVSDGLFTAQLNFGAAAFMGAERWLEITVTLFGSDMVPTKLEPRQPITPAPYALHAFNAGSLMSPGSGPLDIKVAGERALRLEAGSGGAPNVIGGSPLNAAAPGVVGAAIGGGGSSLPGFETPNRVRGNFGTIGGGGLNTIDIGANNSTIGGGYFNTIHEDAAWATIGGGQLNAIQVEALHSTIGGGYGNLTEGSYSSVGGGQGNAAENISATVAGGDSNHAGGVSSAVAGGYQNSAQGPYSLVGGGQANVIATSAMHSVIGGGQGNVIAEGATHSVIGGGINNTNAGYESVVGGGFWNMVTDLRATIGGGAFNRASGTVATVAGGFQNHAAGYVSTVAGGYGNRAEGAYSFVGGGQGNSSEQIGGAVAGGDSNHASAEYASIGGGNGNSAAGYAAVVAGGGGRLDDGETEVGNAATGGWSVVGGGMRNESTDFFATVAGGGSNHATGFGSVVAGGGGLQFEDGNEDRGNTASGGWSAVVGGADNVAGGLFSTIAGGEFNRAPGNYAMVPGGLDCEAEGVLSFAAGWGAKARHNGSFVWADNSPAFGGPPFESTAPNQFMARAAGGVRFFTDATATAGVEVAPGSGTWSSLSDRAKKENFTAAKGLEVLEKVAALPLASWNYKAQDPSVRHLGPTAQDFRAAFGLGESDRTISTVDADGVALAAIQGLNQKLEEKLKAQDAEMRALQAELASLKAAIRALAPEGSQHGPGGAKPSNHKVIGHQ